MPSRIKNYFGAPRGFISGFRGYNLTLVLEDHPTAHRFLSVLLHEAVKVYFMTKDILRNGSIYSQFAAYFAI